MILAMSSTGWPLAGLVSAMGGIVAMAVVAAKFGDKSGQFEDHLIGQDEKLAELKGALAKQDEVLDAQNIALTELRTQLEALREPR